MICGVDMDHTYMSIFQSLKKYVCYAFNMHYTYTCIMHLYSIYWKVLPCVFQMYHIDDMSDVANC